MPARLDRTRVGIVGGGPAGLSLSHLLGAAGIDHVVLETRERAAIEATHRAGILEQGTVQMLRDMGLGDGVERHGHRHDGIDLRFAGKSHRLDFPDLVDAAVWLYPQNEVFADLAAARTRDGADIRWGVSETVVSDHLTSPRVQFREADGTEVTLVCDLLVGTDGSRSTVRASFPRGQRAGDFVEYPFAWFGILTEAPPSAPELIYASSPHGFALVSRRNADVQRMYFQCDPGEDASAWSDDRIWAELERRVAGPDGFRLKEGPIIERTVLPFRSYVNPSLRHGNVLLAGDAGHTVPPTGAKGLNLAFADVQVLFPAIERWARTGDTALLDAYSDTALRRVWRVQSFSYWMTTMLHTTAGATPFQRRRALAELEAVTSSGYGRQYLAEAYTGWPTDTSGRDVGVGAGLAARTGGHA